MSASRSLSEEQKRRIQARLGPRVVAVAQDARSQLRNRELALARLQLRLTAALAIPRSRRATAPSRSAKERRLQEKRQRGSLKQGRRPADDED